MWNNKETKKEKGVWLRDPEKKKALAKSTRVKGRKFSEEEQIYENLRVRIDSPNYHPAPHSPALMPVLKLFFPTPLHAQIATFLDVPDILEGGGKAKTADEVAQETGKEVAVVKQILDDLGRESVLLTSERAGEPGSTEYLLQSLVSLLDIRGCLDVAGLNTMLYGERVSRFKDEVFDQEMSKATYPTWRTVMVDERIDPKSAPLNWELASGIIKANTKIIIASCACRIRRRNCHHRIETCFLFDHVADHYVHLAPKVLGAREVKYVTQEEALQRLKECFDEGLVANTLNQEDPAGALAICMCCSCCCHILGGYATNNTGWGNRYAIAKSNFVPRVQEGKCMLCRTCVELCPVDARWRHYPHKPDLSDDYIYFEEDRCIGCGLCAVHCPTKAITMEKVRDERPEPNRVAMIKRVVKDSRH